MTDHRSKHWLTQAKSRRTRPGTIVCSLSLIAILLAAPAAWGRTPARAAKTKTPSQPSTAAKRTSPQKNVAVVNREQITRKQLADECLMHYGKDVLESLVNKMLIVQQCKRQNITVTRAEVDAEIRRMAGRFSLPTERWLEMLEQERGIKPAQYASDIIWPTLALRRLAGQRLTVTREELIKAYESQYGDAVDARLISCKDREKTKKAHAAALGDPDNFGTVAMKFSEDASAGLKGRIQPIRKHGTYSQIEQAAFSMKDGEISDVIPAGGQYVVIQRLRLLPGATAVDFKQVAPQLEELIRDGKLRAAAKEIFEKLQKDAQVVNVLNDPAKRGEMPGVAAVINRQQITMSHLAEQCVQRHGMEVLEGTLNRKLIEQACKRGKITISEADLDREIVRAASVSVPTKDGKPDVEAWLELVTEQQGVSVEVYRRDSVWPSVALEKLVEGKVKITNTNLKKGYEANYGPRVRCLMIVLDDLRRAQKVWDMARAKPTAEYFGDLAEEYSSDSRTRVMRGETPPIRRHGGQALLEKEAFALKPGELSGIINVDGSYLILFCQGRTEPTEVDFASVRDLIYKDIFEKKQRIVMAKYFEQLKQSATIDNYLAGTSHRPQKSGRLKPAANVPKLRQVPGKR